MKNLPNKKGMDLVPKGPADHELEKMNPEEKQGFANRHDFTLPSDKNYLEKLRKQKEDEVKGSVL